MANTFVTFEAQVLDSDDEWVLLLVPGRKQDERRSSASRRYAKCASLLEPAVRRARLSPTRPRPERYQAALW